MKSKKMIKCAIGFILTFCLALAMVACNNETEPAVENEGAVSFVAQVGYDWEIPVPNNINDYRVTVEGNDAELNVTDNKVHFDKVGKYTVSYIAGETVKTAVVNVVDTEKPRFGKFWQGEWRDNVTYGQMITIKKDIGESVNLNDYFECVDNSGYADVSFQVLRGGVDEVTLSDGNSFEVEDVDYYWIYATAKDASNNYTRVKYKLTVNQPTATGSYTNKTGANLWGAIRFDTGDIGLGEQVNITFKVKTDITNQYSLLCYVNGSGTVSINPTGGFGIFKTYTDWTEVSFTAKVVTGADARMAIQNYWSDGKNYMPNSPINDMEQGVFIVILHQGNNQSVWTKDVSIEKIEQITVDDAEYSYTHAAGETNWGTLELPATGYEVGDKVKVTFKLKTDITSQWVTLDYVDNDGANAMPFGFEVLNNNYKEWTEISFEAQVVTGATAKAVAKGYWKDAMPGATVGDDETGIFFILVNSQAGKTVWVKDLVITAI